MDPTVGESVKRLEARLNGLSSQMDELRQNVRQVAAVARGTFSLSRRGEQRIFDFEGKRQSGATIEKKGIYAFEGDFLRVCYTFTTRAEKGRDLARPESFVLDRGGRGLSLKFRRVGE
jgi:hypothetical protein